MTTHPALSAGNRETMRSNPLQKIQNKASIFTLKPIYAPICKSIDNNLVQLHRSTRKEPFISLLASHMKVALGCSPPRFIRPFKHRPFLKANLKGKHLFSYTISPHTASSAIKILHENAAFISISHPIAAHRNHPKSIKSEQVSAWMLRCFGSPTAKSISPLLLNPTSLKLPGHRAEHSQILYLSVT